jgi:hypothetical protein
VNATINCLMNIHTQQEARHSNHNSWLHIQLTLYDAVHSLFDLAAVYNVTPLSVLLCMQLIREHKVTYLPFSLKRYDRLLARYLPAYSLCSIRYSAQTRNVFACFCSSTFHILYVSCVKKMVRVKIKMFHLHRTILWNHRWNVDQKHVRHQKH